MIKPTHLMHWIAVGFGSGLAKKAPGTFGTLAALPLVAMAWFTLPTLMYALLGLVLCVIGTFAADKTAKDFAIQDPSFVVIDEWAGLWCAVIALPFSWFNLVLAFVLFRMFDILKPWPVGWADKRLKGGFGIMADDILAGGMTCVCLHAVAFVL